VNDSGLLIRFLIISPLLIVSLVLHELAHGWVAYQLGDPTAKAHGRLSLNPIRHMDLWGTAVLAITFVHGPASTLLQRCPPLPSNAITNPAANAELVPTTPPPKSTIVWYVPATMALSFESSAAVCPQSMFGPPRSVDQRCVASRAQLATKMSWTPFELSGPPPRFMLP
jgi:hypothetical protein